MRRRAFDGVVLLALGVFAPGCQELVSNTTAKSYVKECVLPDDQASTLSGKWRATPVPVAFHEGDFSGDEMKMVFSRWKHERRQKR
jgi:hypothetical protein